MEIKGSKESEKSLECISEQIEQLQNELEISFDKLFNENFMQQYTSYNTWNEFLNKSGFGVKNDEDLKKIPHKKLNRYIRKATSFKNWENMFNKATEIYMYKQIGV